MITLCRSVCEQLLGHLDMSNMLFWGEALSTVRAIVGGVDYKVRTHLACSPLSNRCDFLFSRAAEIL